ncbi:flagellar hook-associated protein FlgL [Thauera sp.]|uniref:flagellar hook-associated protein FlgL n=1 Tax=Thauera sp. TaxID=1905334 RepID=UPI0039E638ED
MRISTNMIYDKGVGSIQQQWGSLLHTQQQLSTGRRVLTPADDPIASARALEIGQSQGVNNQFMANTGYAEDKLNLLESQLDGVGEILQYMRQKTVAAGNPTFKEEDLRSLGIDLRAQFDALMALANTKDGMGDYIFSGYRSNQQPFSGDLAGVVYSGDEGTQTVQVSASRFMPVSLPGSDVFARTRTLTDSVYVGNGTQNTGEAAVSGSAAIDPATGAPYAEGQGRRFEIEYNGGAYDVYEHRPGVAHKITVATGLSDLSSLGDPASPNFVGLDFNVSSGPPADGDRFEVFSASTNMFDNLGIMIDALERPGPAGTAAGAVAFGLENIDRANENILKVVAQIGSQLVETESLQSLGSDLNLQYTEVITGLTGMTSEDWVEGLSRLTQQRTYLEAAQQSFMRVSGLSLFNFLN